MTTKHIGSLIGGFLLCCAAGKVGNLFPTPAHFPEPIYSFENNEYTVEKVELGRMLFFDPILSKDQTISCASCHSPYNGFAHTDHELSHGINDQIGTRNAPALFNLAWKKSFMWDGAVNHLDVQALAPLTHEKEMGETLPRVLEKLQHTAHYPALFKETFGDENITGEYFLKAMAAFQLSLVSSNSTYDQVARGEMQFTEQEAQGLKLFEANCATCHVPPLFTSNDFETNGLPLDTTLNDFGRMKVTKRSNDSLSFTVPSLRNLSFTKPYMHDGRFETLTEVVNHYVASPKEIQTIENNFAQPIELTANEQVDLISFLRTLNDKEFVFNPLHQFPKKLLSFPKE
ncbi:MAG: cytochrome c peroxidase [Flavobacteriales bacterium]|nr:cytochrome c peroxidase [Flavobacteriales bacterium]